MQDSLQAFNQKLASIGDQKRQRLEQESAEKKLKLDPSWREVQPDQVSDYDPDTMRLEGESFSRRLAAEKGFSPDSYERAPSPEDAANPDFEDAYQKRPGTERAHKEQFALKYGLTPDEVTKEDLFREERAQAKEKEEFFKDGRFIRETGEIDPHGRPLTEEVNAQGESWGQHLSQFGNNANFLSDYNRQAQVQHILSGESAEFEADRRPKTAGEAVGDAAKQFGVSTLEMGANLGLEAAQVMDKLVNPASWVQMARGKESIGSQAIRELGLSEKVEEMASSAREDWLSGPELKEQAAYAQRTEQYDNDAPHRIQQYEEQGYSPKQAELLNTKDEFLHQITDLWDNPARALNMMAESAPSLLGTAAAGKAIFTQGAKKLAQQMGKSVDEVLKDPAALKKLNKMTVGGGIAAGSLMEGGMAAAEMRNKVLGTDHETLKGQSDQYNAMLEKGLSPDEARGKLADNAANMMFAQMTALAGLTSVATGAGAFEAKLLTGGIDKQLANLGIKGNIQRGAKQVAADSTKEGVEEIIQSGGEQMLSNITGQRMLGEEGSILKGVGGAAGAGLIAGAGMGGAASTTQNVVQESKRAIQGRGNPAQNVPQGYKLGNIAAKYESGGRGAGTISTGKGDRGGKSYGTHQFASKTGSLQAYLKKSKYGSEFQGLTPGSAAFDDKWKSLAKNDPGFAQDQRDYITKTHYEPVLAKTAHLGMRERGAAVQEMLFSTGVQFGAGGASSLIKKALKGKDSFAMSDADIVNAVQDYKRDNVNSLFKSSSAGVRASVAKRIEKERADLLGLGEGKFEGQGQTVGQGGVGAAAQSENNWAQQEDTTPTTEEEEHSDEYYFKEFEKSGDASQLTAPAREAAFRHLESQSSALIQEAQQMASQGASQEEINTKLQARAVDLQSMERNLNASYAAAGQEGVEYLGSSSSTPGTPEFNNALFAATEALQHGQLQETDISKVPPSARPILEGAKAEYQLQELVKSEKLGEQGGATGPSLQQHGKAIDKSLAGGDMIKAADSLAALEKFAGTQRSKITRHEQALAQLKAGQPQNQYGVKSQDPDVIQANLDTFKEEQPLMEKALGGQLAKYNLVAEQKGEPELSLDQLQGMAAAKAKGPNYEKAAPGESALPKKEAQKETPKATPATPKKPTQTEAKPAPKEKAPKTEAKASPKGKTEPTPKQKAPEKSFEEALLAAKEGGPETEGEPEGRLIEDLWGMENSGEVLGEPAAKSKSGRKPGSPQKETAKQQTGQQSNPAPKKETKAKVLPWEEGPPEVREIFGHKITFLDRGHPRLKGTIALSTSTGIIVQKGITQAQVLGYLEGHMGGSPSSKQKAVVTAFMKSEFDIDLIPLIKGMNDQDLRKFIIQHEISHVENNDKASYYSDTAQTIAGDKGDKENKFLADSAIRIEARANMDALKKLGLLKSEADLVLDAKEAELKANIAEANAKVVSRGPIESLSVELNGKEVNAVNKAVELNNIIATLERMQRGEC